MPTPFIGRRSALTAVLALAMAGGAHAQSKPPIKIVHTAPLSGQLGTVGKLQGIAIDLAVEDINASGGINGSKIELVRYDDQLRPDQGVLRVREAKDNGALAVFGPMSSTQWETAGPTINQLKIPAINMNSNKPGLTSRPYGTRMNTPDDIGLPAGFDQWVKLYPQARKVAIIADVREAAGKAARDEWARLAKAKGLDVVGSIDFTSGMTDFSPVAIKLKDLAPDFVLGAILQGDAVKLAREFQIQNFTAPVLTNQLLWPGVFPASVAKVVGDQAKQWNTLGFSSNGYSTGDAAKYKSFVERYSAVIAKDSTLNQVMPPNVSNASLGYDAILLFADVARKAGIDGSTPIDTAREKVKDGIDATKDFRGLNEIKFNDKGDGLLQTVVLQVDPAAGVWKFVGAK